MRTLLLVLLMLLVSSVGFSQTNFYHENLYKYLRKDITAVKKDIRKQGALKLVSKWKDGQDSIVLLYWLKGQNIYYTFFIENKICSYIGASDGTSTVEETITAFRKKYNEVTEDDLPGYLEDYSTRDYETKAYFEDGSMNIGFLIFEPRDNNEESVVYFYSRFMIEDL